MAVIKLAGDSSELSETLTTLSAQIAKAGGEFTNLALDLVKIPAQLVRIDNGATLGATVTLLFKPSDLLLDFVAAVRACNLDDFLIKYPHLSAP